MKIIESVKFKCDYCGTEHKRRDMAESCEDACYIRKMSNCELCKHYRKHVHIKSPPTRFMRKILKSEQKWTEVYCRCLKFYERWTQSRKMIPSWMRWGRASANEKFKARKLNSSKDFRLGKKGIKCDRFAMIDGGK